MRASARDLWLLLIALFFERGPVVGAAKPRLLRDVNW